jgi:hypothetical protein
LGSTLRRLGQRAALADPAIAFEDQIPEITVSAFAVVVQADSIVLLRTRAWSSGATVRRTSLTKADAGLREIFRSMSDITANAALIKEFFLTPRALTNSDAAATIGESLSGLAGQVDGISRTLSRDDGFTKASDSVPVERIL